MHHEVVCGYQGFENHHPAGVAGPLHQCVGHLGDIHVGILGGLDQDWPAERREGIRGQMMGISRGDSQHRSSLYWKPVVELMTLQRAVGMMEEDRWVRKENRDGMNSMRWHWVWGLLHFTGTLSHPNFHFHSSYAFPSAVFPRKVHSNCKGDEVRPIWTYLL